MENVIAQSADVEELGEGVSFRVQKDGRIWPAFIVRYEGKALCYLNACAHVGLRLNGAKNEFFGDNGTTLICRAHGAIYEAATGECTQGPCTGYSLISLAIQETNGAISYQDETYELVQ